MLTSRFLFDLPLPPLKVTGIPVDGGARDACGESDEMTRESRELGFHKQRGEGNVLKSHKQNNGSKSRSSFSSCSTLDC